MRVPESAKPPRLGPGTAALAGLLASCGAGTVAVLAGQAGSSGSTPTTISAFTVLEPRQPSTAQVRFTLSQSAAVELHYRLPGGGEDDVTQIVVPALLAGGTWTLPWDFEGEEKLDACFQPGVLVYATIPGVLEEPREGANAVTVDLGNDAPTIAVDTPALEVDGVVPISLLIGDSSDEVIDVYVEFDDGSGWRVARRGGIDPAEPTPEFVSMPVSPEKQPFFWDSDFDLPQLERSVRLRVTPRDPDGPGLSVETGSFVVDNNAAPIAQLDSGVVVINPDQRRGIPIPLRVIDEEGDAVQLLFQWRRRGEDFPELPTERGALDAALADPVERARLHVCSPYPHYARGRVSVIDADSVRLPELGSTEAWILHAGMVGQTLELLRPSKLPVPVETRWSAAPLVAPVGIVPLGDGLNALVLDGSSPARLREIRLANGNEVRSLAAFGTATPSILALERSSQDAALVALEEGGRWRVERVSFADGSRLVLYQSNGSRAGPVHGLASLSGGALLLSVGDSLLQLDYRDPNDARVSKLLDGLAEPRGIAIDPLRTGHVFLAESAAPTESGTGRVLSVDLARRSAEEVVIVSTPGIPLERPEALAVQRNGARLLIVTRDELDVRHLIGVDLGGRTGNATFAFGAPIDAPVHALSSGPEELVLLLTGGNEQQKLRVGGGIEQRRTVAAYDLASGPGERSKQIVTLDGPLDPPALEGQPWRIPLRERRTARPEGLVTTFVWDNADAYGDLSTGASPQAEIFLRVTPRDDEPGTASVGSAPKLLRTAFDTDPVRIGDGLLTPDPTDVLTADFNRDGRADLACTNGSGDSVTLFLQGADGSFALSGVPLSVGDGPAALVAADLDQDGNPDLAVANRTGSSLTVLYGPTAAGTSETLGGVGQTNGATDLASLDLEGDGDLDLVSVNESGDSLTLFLRTGSDFTPVAPLEGLDGPVALAHGDLDGDGAPDLVAALGGAGELALLRNAVSGLEQLPPLTPSFAPISVVLADLDLDGDLDVSATTLNSEIATFLQDGQGTFLAPTYMGGNAVGLQNLRALSAPDLESDGLLDLVVAAKNTRSGRLAAFLQRSRGTFGPIPLLLRTIPDPLNSFPNSLCAGDLDGDGDLDLACANEASDDLSVIFQASASSLALPGEVVPLRSVIPKAMTPADLKGDGDLDLILGKNPNAAGIVVLEQETPGRFGSQVEFSALTSTTDLTSGDLDGDGDVDFLLTSLPAGMLAIALQTSEASLAPSQTWGYTEPQAPAVADLDRDGLMDLVCVIRRQDQVAVHFQEIAGFPPQATLLLGAGTSLDDPRGVAAADLDADGLVDLVVAGERSDDLTLFYQRPGRLFEASGIGGDSRTNGPYAVVADDIDADGDLDLACANKAGNDLAIFYQRTDRSFSEPVNLRAANDSRQPEVIKSGDLDGDGDVDLALACTGSNTICLFLQDSPGTFRPTPILFPSVEPKTIHIADIDGDGDNDLVVSSTRETVPLSLFWGGR